MIKKPIAKKSFKLKDRKPVQKFAEGGAVQRFLDKYPDFRPEAA